MTKLFVSFSAFTLLFSINAFASIDVKKVSGLTNTSYETQSGACRVEFSISKKMPDRSEIRNTCPLSDEDSLKALDAALSVALKEVGSTKIHSLLVASQDGGNAALAEGNNDIQRQPTFHLRLAKLLKESKEWDAKKGKALKSSKEDLVVKLLKKDNPMPELFDLFKKHSLKLSYKSVEEFRTLKERVHGNLYPSIGAKPTDVFPDSMSIYLNVENI